MVGQCRRTRSTAGTELIWHQSDLSVSLELQEKARLTAATSVIDVDASTSRALGALIFKSLSDLTVLYFSESTFDATQWRLGEMI